MITTEEDPTGSQDLVIHHQGLLVSMGQSDLPQMSEMYVFLNKFCKHLLDQKDAFFVTFAINWQ